MDDLRRNDEGCAGLVEPIARWLGSMWRSGWGGVEEDIDVIALSQRVEGGGKNLVFQPEAGEDQKRAILCGERLDEAVLRPWGTVLLENKPAMVCRAGHVVPGLWRLLLGAGRQDEYWNTRNVGSSRDDSESAPMIGAHSRVDRSRILRIGGDEDEGADGRIHEWRIGDAPLFHIYNPKYCGANNSYSTINNRKIMIVWVKWFTLRVAGAERWSSITISQHQDKTSGGARKRRR
jgi:hypothetical protein